MRLKGFPLVLLLVATATSLVYSQVDGNPVLNSTSTYDMLFGNGYDFYTLLSHRDTYLTRIIVLALEPNTTVTLDTNWDGSPELAWESGIAPCNTTVFDGDNTSIPPGTHINSNKPIMVAQWHGMETVNQYIESGGMALLPYELWGRQYLAPGFYDGKIEVTAPIPGTAVTFDVDNDGEPEHTWTSNSTHRHHLWGTPNTRYETANVTATNKIEVATVCSFSNDHEGTPSLARLSLPIEWLGREYYLMQQFPGFTGAGDERVGASCPFLPNNVSIQMDIRTSTYEKHHVTSYSGSDETAVSIMGSLDTEVPLVSYVNSTLPMEAYYVTFAYAYSNKVDVFMAATGIPVKFWGKDYFVIADPEDTQLGTYIRLVEIIAPNPNTHVAVDVDHDGSWEYEWTSTASNVNFTFTDLPSGSRVHGDKPFAAQQVVYRDDYRDARAYELLPIAGISVTNISTSKTGCLPRPTVGKGYNVSIYIPVENEAGFEQAFNVVVYANSSEIFAKQAILASGENRTITFEWDTAGFDYGRYIFAVNVDGYNRSISDWVFLTIPGDVDGDKDVDIYDIVRMSGVYGVAHPDPRFDPNSDWDNDGYIDIYDIVIAADNYGKSW